jgi:hypothetical protein
MSLPFIDEVEEVASQRERGSLTAAAVVNELLKSLVAFRSVPMNHSIPHH